jgi:Bacterial Ig-like domain
LPIHLRAIVAVVAALGLVLAISTAAWAAPSVSILLGPDGPTNITMPVFEFTTDVDATTDCSIVPDQAAPVYSSCSGTYAPDTPLDEGAYVFWVRATDTLLEQTEASQAFSVDTTPPSLSIDVTPTGLTNDRTPTFEFTTDASRVECSVVADQAAPAYSSCASPYTASALSDGSWVFFVRATDAAGNQRELSSQAFSLDATPPVAGVTSGPDGPTNNPLPSFGFTVDGDPTRVECSIDQGTSAYVSCSAPAYASPVSLPDGRYTFRVRGTDAAGNVGTAAIRRFSVDRDAPDLKIDSGPEGPTNNAAPSFGFTAEPGASAKCSIDQGTPAYVTCSATYASTGPLPEGAYTFRVQATDGVGNQAAQSRSFTVDTTTPSLSISFGPAGATSDNTPLFGFLAEARATVACSIDQGTPAYGPCSGAGSHAAVAPLADGAYAFRVRATDSAGNETIATRGFTVDTIPDVPGPTPGPTPSKLQLLSPFPLVRISGTLTPIGARIRLLSVRASPGTLVRVTVNPGCSGKRRSARRCRVLRVAGTVGRRAVIRFSGLARTYRSGTVIVVRVWRADRIGKYTRFTIMRGKAPRRVDQCLLPAATSGSRCPSA